MTKDRKEYSRKYYQKNKKKIREFYKEWYAKNGEAFRKRIREHQKVVKLIVIKHYSNDKNCCACCSENRIEFLTIDHKKGDGNEHRKKHKSNHIYEWLIKNGFPKEFRVLCMNCNFSLGKYGYCPHLHEQEMS